jgi:hypothetical protein
MSQFSVMAFSHVRARQSVDYAHIGVVIPLKTGSRASSVYFSATDDSEFWYSLEIEVEKNKSCSRPCRAHFCEIGKHNKIEHDLPRRELHSNFMVSETEARCSKKLGPLER